MGGILTDGPRNPYYGRYIVGREERGLSAAVHRPGEAERSGE
jgi:hypothetical protein